MQDRLQIDTASVRGSGGEDMRERPNSNRPRFKDLHVFSGTRQNVQPHPTPDRPRKDPPILRVRPDRAKSLHDAHSRTDTPKDSVFVVQERRRSKRYEELRS